MICLNQNVNLHLSKNPVAAPYPRVCYNEIRCNCRLSKCRTISHSRVMLPVTELVPLLFSLRPLSQTKREFKWNKKKLLFLFSVTLFFVQIIQNVSHGNSDVRRDHVSTMFLLVMVTMTVPMAPMKYRTCVVSSLNIYIYI